jgi:predicted RNA binding protein YcfA (HicA-like mRNA interferase family)
MKLPRGVSGDRLIRALESLGYRVVRQKGSHVRLTAAQMMELVQGKLKEMRFPGFMARMFTKNIPGLKRWKTVCRLTAKCRRASYSGVGAVARHHQRDFA